MPRNAVVSKRYVRALTFLADDKHDPELAKKILAELQGLWGAVKTSKELKSFFVNPVISKSDKKEVLAELKDKLPITQRFFSALIDSGRFVNLPEIIEEFEKYLEGLTGELSVSLESARSLSDSQVEEIRAMLQEKWGRKLKIQTKLNPEILGGFVARAPGRILDASLSHQFEILKQSLAG